MIKCSLINCNGVRAVKTQPKVRQLCFNALNFDVTFVTETHLTPDREFVFSKYWSHQIFLNHNTLKPFNGLLILAKPSVNISILHSSTDGRTLITKLQSGESYIIIVLIYAPTRQHRRIRFFRNLLHITGSIPEDSNNIMILGDFNCVQNPSLDRLNQLYRNTHMTTLETLLTRYSLVDCFRQKLPTLKSYTYYNHDYSKASKIDQVYLSLDSVYSVRKIQHKRSNFSDHSYINSELSHTTNAPRGPGTWCFNTKHLKSSKFRDLIVKTWVDWRKYKTLYTLPEWWEEGKFILQNAIIKYAKNESRIWGKHLTSLNRRLHNAIKHNKTSSINTLKLQLQHLQQEKVDAHFLLKRTEWAAEGEKGSSYFFNLAKKKS